MLTVCTHFDLGKHGEDIRPKNLESLLKFTYFAGFFGTLATVWSKSSFAITLLAFSEGRTRKIVWFILISINVIMGTSAMLLWIQCWPIQKLWMGGEGVCWLKFKRLRVINTVSRRIRAVRTWRLRCCRGRLFGMRRFGGARRLARWLR